MRKRRFKVKLNTNLQWLWLLAILFLLPFCASGSESDQWLSSEFLPGRIIVDFESSAKMETCTRDANDVVRVGIPVVDSLFIRYEVRVLRRLVPDGILIRLKAPCDFWNTYVLQFSDARPVLDVVDDFARNPFVHDVQPDVLRRIFRTPNDQLWQQQWDKRIMRADGVWDVSLGSRKIICAGIDTGVDWNHPDLTPSLWVNPGEDLDGDGVAWTWDQYPGDPDDFNDADDDNDGYVDDFLGWDFLIAGGCDSREDCDDHTDNNMFGINSHGTHVAGIMEAAGNNGIGVTGVNWVGTLMALRAGYQSREGQGYIPESASIPAILFAAAHGANVINMSYGGPGFSGPAQQAINSAWDQGCLLVAASGNDGSTDLQYPAAYDNVIAVNATDNQDRLASWSNRGVWSDLCAPGSDPGIMSTVINSYASYWGTSMASPNAAGVAALVWSLFPDFSNAQIRDLLFAGAVNISSRNPGIPASHLGYGRVDALQTVLSLCPNMTIASYLLTDDISGDGDGRLERGESARLVIQCTNSVGWSTGSNILMHVIADDPHVSVVNGSVVLGDVAPGQTVSNESNPVILTAADDLDKSVTVNFQIVFVSSSGCEIVRPVSVVVGRGSVLLVDDDAGAGYESFYADALSSKNVSAEMWRIVVDGEVSAFALRQYPVVLWSCGDAAFSTLTAADQANLTDYLNGGGQLILVGQNIDEDIGASAFYSDYLHVQSVQSVGSQNLTGAAGNPVSDGMTLILRGGVCANNGYLSPSVIRPVNGAQPLFTYSQGGVGAVQFAGTYKVAYFAFALESACGLENTTRYADVLASLMDWMNPSADIPDSPNPLPRSAVLYGNYPNPFNAATTLVFDISVPGYASLRVFDLLGRSVATLMDGYVHPGSQRILFHASDLSSGIYVVRLESGGVSASSKMVLIK
ncbi:T9SS C-terminal target domain-containing protein [candidate division KSB1 bacterium]|nr:MAG: T9SS C-terminal target domain-containing protein [candidate division KSB1 bacterium]